MMWPLSPHFLLLFSWQHLSRSEITGLLVYFLPIAPPLPCKHLVGSICLVLFSRRLGQCLVHSNCSVNIHWMNASEINASVKHWMETPYLLVFFLCKSLCWRLRWLQVCAGRQGAGLDTALPTSATEVSKVLSAQAELVFTRLFNLSWRLSELWPSAWPGEEFSFRFKVICWSLGLLVLGPFLKLTGPLSYGVGYPGRNSLAVVTVIQ